MERLADIADDIDSLVAIKKRNLNSDYNYFEIAKIYSDAKRHDEALQWAEAGYKKFNNQHHSSLTEFLISEYQRRKQYDKATSLCWNEFTKAPALTRYRQLKSCADKTRDWPHWRDKALQTVKKTAGTKTVNRQHHWAGGGHSLLVEIYLWEKDIDNALREAKAGDCSEHLWFELAQQCEKPHPQEAIDIYQNHIEGIIRQTNNDAYDRATTILKRIKNLMTRLKQQNDFAEYLEKLKVQYKQKRNFMKRIDVL